jgi:hypothetical protein
MGGIVRVVAWGWLLAGLAALASGYLGRHGIQVPLPESLAITLSLPWNSLGPALGLAGAGAVAVVIFGLLINFLVLMVIANILDR